jgi:hypothetical protein
MRTIEQIEAEIASLQAELEERKSEPDLGAAVEKYKCGAEVPHAPDGNVHCRLIAAYPALRLLIDQPPVRPEPAEAEDLAMAQEVFRSFDYLGHVTDVIVAAFKAERKRAGGGK